MKLDNDLFVKHLQGMVRIPTVSSVDPDKIDKEAFLKLHKYLEETYPLVHKTFKKEIVGRVGLLYHWKGTGKSNQLPLLLLAHQDVVPEGDHAMWKYPPYEGVIADGVLWGRGCQDCKSHIESYMDALELLIADGFVPDYDIYLAFGYNEEIMGGPEAAAGLLRDELKRRGIQVGLALDEGGNITKEESGLIAHICPAEKGYADYEFSYEDIGGHASQPGEHSALGIIGKTACILEEKRFPQRLTKPAIDELKALAPLTEGELGEMFKDPEANWEKLKPIFIKDRKYDAMTHTTVACTMAKGSDQANILPERAWMVINTRLLPGDTTEGLLEYFKSIVPEGVKVRFIKGHNAPPLQSTDTDGYRLIQSILEEKFPGISFVPTFVLGGTDSRFYCDICPTNSVYRFSAQLRDSRSGGVHQINERIACDVLYDNVDFLIKLIQRYGDK